ncbi:MAG: hypothetical protein KAV82_15080 [Phycisphaerae bacterium]|nr:hypothetical protein [Phycisphaerae bacterium]
MVCRVVLSAVLLLSASPGVGDTAPTATPTDAKAKDERKLPPLKIRQVEPLRRSFNPSANETVAIRFSMTKPAKVTLIVYGPNRELIARVRVPKPCGAGLNTLDWGGRDIDGIVVPDEAYTFELQAVAGDEGDLWDPLLTSGGERVTASALKTLDRYRFTYQLPKASRVLVRAGVVNGPLARTIVNWEPRTRGLCLEHWDGKDESGLRRVVDIPDVRIAVAAMALPDKSVITTGNSTLDYRTYYLSRGRHRQHKPPAPRMKAAGALISPHWSIPVHLNRDPQVEMSLVGIDDQPMTAPSSQPTTQPATTQTATVPADPRVAVIRRGEMNPILVRVDLPDPTEREFMLNQRFELIVYVDDKRVAEVEQGHVPFAYPWDISGLAPGRHVLTMGVTSFRNHCGTASRIVEIHR